MAWRKVLLTGLLSATVAACTSGGGGDQSGCSGSCATAASLLTVADVNLITSRAVEEAKARGASGTIAVTDRVGNVLSVYRMTGADTSTTTSTTLPNNEPVIRNRGLEGIEVIPDTMAAIAKAVTASFLSTEGNAFTTRTANQIVQEHFNPGELRQPGGPLFGVQFSQLPCSDFNKRFTDADNVGPKRSPLGLSADPGGIPLYKDGVPVGGIGVIADGIYGIDKNLLDTDSDLDEIIALAGSTGFEAPTNRRADRITADGKVLRFTDATASSFSSNPSAAPAAPTGGAQVAVTSYYAGTVLAGTAFSTPDSGVRLATAADFPVDGADFVTQDSFILVDGTDSNRFTPAAGATGENGAAGLTVAEVSEVLKQALIISNRARGQIRRPLGTPARVSISVVDNTGAILGIVRGRDAPVFGLDVSIQKARTATFFSTSTAAALISTLPDAEYLDTDVSAPHGSLIDLDDYTTAVRDFLGDPAALANGAFAFADRSGGNLSRPFYPDGINGNPNGPLSKAFSDWSVFSSGFQLDISYNAIIRHVAHVAGLAGTDVDVGCAGHAGISAGFTPPGATVLRLANGTQIFPGSVPIYRGNDLIGGIGVSGDGVDQDDMISFLGVHNAGENLGTINNAPANIRADQLVPNGVRLRYINCPQSPFLDSTEEDVCNGK
ncbi:MAG: heme-binding protein [Gammaproteobacteria bacterium]|nr:heme-binding protein [Gammaproteobacteria bacterium]